MLRLPAAEGPDRVNDAMVKRVAPYLEQGGIIVMPSLNTRASAPGRKCVTDALGLGRV